MQQKLPRPAQFELLSKQGLLEYATQIHQTKKNNGGFNSIINLKNQHISFALTHSITASI